MSEFIERTVSRQSTVRRKLVHGVGVNDAEYVVTYKNKDGKSSVCPYYSKWVSMLSRCYNPRCHIKCPTYKGCSVSEEWASFSNFKRWMEKQDWKGKHLDKDLLIKGNLLYSADTCIFIDPFINGLLIKNYRVTGLPRGITWNTPKTKYVARCTDVAGNMQRLGSFLDLNEAERTYCDYKASVFMYHANQQSDERIKEALLRESNEMLEKSKSLS